MRLAASGPDNWVQHQWHYEYAQTQYAVTLVNETGRELFVLRDDSTLPPTLHIVARAPCTHPAPRSFKVAPGDQDAPEWCPACGAIRRQETDAWEKPGASE